MENLSFYTIVDSIVSVSPLSQVLPAPLHEYFTQKKKKKLITFATSKNHFEDGIDQEIE